MKRLIEQTACEHGYSGECPHVSFYEKSGDCPGGTSREVTVDYPEPYELGKRYETLGQLIHSIGDEIDRALGVTPLDTEPPKESE